MARILGYRNFWVQPENTIENFFIPLFESALGEEVRFRKDDGQEIDIELTSVFKSRDSVLIRILRKFRLGFLIRIISNPMSANPKEVKRVWFTGENKRPPLTENYDAYLGFEHKSRKYPGVKEIISDLKFSKENDKWNISKKNYENGGFCNIKG